MPADAIGHHPYSFFTRPDERSKNRDDATLADSRRLLSALDRLTARRALRPMQGRRLDVYYTEFGYQTDPPDPFAGIPLARQDRFLQEAAYIVWKTPRVRAINQFRLTDGRVSRAGGYKGFNEFQSGLYFRDFRPKPSARSFPTPLFLAGNRLWGQIRPGHGNTVHTVTIEFRSGGGSYREVGTVRTNQAGYFITPVPVGRGEFRVRYGEGGPEQTSQPLQVGSG